MKTRTRTSLAMAFVAAAVFSASTASAGTPGDCGEMRGDHGMHGGMHRMHGMKHRADPAALIERADQRLAKLEGALALSPTQRAAWDEFSSTMRGKAAQSAERIEAMRTRERASTAVERLERMEEFAKERLESMQEMRKAVSALYAQLDESQKKTFDEQFRFAGPRHRGEGRHGLGRTERGAEPSPGA